ncbi:MAG: lamin tail domain-containing protein [Deltaproteobacteria bacterium]|nr:lamin tail domain-containing protein [Deltaproteobacteria bacterium]
MSHLRQNSSYWSLLLVLVVAFGLAGCGDDESNPTCDPACDANLCMTCQDGTCVTTCTAGQTCNAGTCVDDTTCDPACDANLCMACVDGTCESTCTAGQICDAGTCVADNTCDPACDADLCMACVDGTCESTCALGQVCDGAGTCVADTTCDPACDADLCMTCDAGTCVTSCTEGQTCDGSGTCVADNVCDPACDADQCMTCVDGTCESTCTEGQTCDGSGTCVADTTCDPACDADLCMTCVDGACESTCTLGQVCDGAGTCVADDTCSPACDADMCMVCSDGTCVTSCTAVEACDGAGACVSNCDSMADIRAQADGPLDTPIQICPAYVTYLTDTGFFLQKDPEGPAIYSFEGWDWNADNLLAVGDYITMPITELTTYFGLKEITDHDTIEVLTTGNSIDSLIQDLSAGTVPSEDLESEIVSLTEATITAIDGSDLTIDYGTATGVEIHASELDGSFCVDATFDFLGLGGDNNGTHNLRSFYVTDFSNINTDDCPDLGRAPVAGDLVLNEFLADPPAGDAGDANCDGTREGTEDEFIEIINISGEDLNLSGVVISDSANPKYTFVAYSLPADQVLLVYGGGIPTCTLPANVQTLIVGGNGLGLNNSGDEVNLADANDVSLISYSYGAEANHDQSMTLTPDITGTSYEQHATADTVDGSLFSPGTAIDGSALAP